MSERASLCEFLPRDYIEWLRAEIQPKEKGYKSGEFWPPKLFLSSEQTAETVGGLLEEIDFYRAALERIAAQQPHTLGWMQEHEVRFDGPLGTDPKNFEHVAFSVYTDLCEVDTWARDALSAAE